MRLKSTGARRKSHAALKQTDHVTTSAITTLWVAPRAAVDDDSRRALSCRCADRKCVVDDRTCPQLANMADGGAPRLCGPDARLNVMREGTRARARCAMALPSGGGDVAGPRRTGRAVHRHVSSGRPVGRPRLPLPPPPPPPRASHRFSPSPAPRRTRLVLAPTSFIRPTTTTTTCETAVDAIFIRHYYVMSCTCCRRLLLPACRLMRNSCRNIVCPRCSSDSVH